MARICLVHGNHTPGSDWEKECPVLRAARRAAKTVPATTPTGYPGATFIWPFYYAGFQHGSP